MKEPKPINEMLAELRMVEARLMGPPKTMAEWDVCVATLRRLTRASERHYANADDSGPADGNEDARVVP